jgi:hypothetical protein
MNHSRTRLFAGAVLTSAIGLFATVAASGPQYWTVASQADFLEGRPTGVTIDAHGRLLPSPAVTVVNDLTAPQAWSLTGANGTWYAGTGGDGRVVRGRDQDVSTILDVEPAGIHAVATSGARVFAGSSPDGAVHVVEADGTSRVFFDPAEPYIWALAFDRDGQLWVGAGHPATIYRVAPDGAATVVARPPARHVVSLAVDQSGRILAGTDLPARLYRIEGGTRLSVLFESPLTEMRAIRPTTDGGAFAVGLSASGEPGGEAAVTGSVTITVGGAQLSSSSTAGPEAPPTGRRSILYRVAASGDWDAIWDTTDAIYDIAVIDPETVLIATGPDGRIYQVRTDGSAQLITAIDARQVTRLLRDGNRTLMATANPGRIVALGSTAAAPTAASTYTSTVRDGRTLTRWGTIQWDATSGVTLQTRTGNTEVPDESWSDWSDAYSTSAGQAITSPVARYLQWRASFPAGSSLTSVTVAYLPRNSKPAVTEITIHPAGVVFQRPFASDEGAIAGLDDAIAATRRPPGADAPSAPSLGRRMFQRGLRTLQWKADDPDEDRLTYTLEYRREGETDWRPLRADLADPLFVWDTTSVADGRYFVRVTASDASTNTADRVLTGHRDSDAVDVDNTPPVITVSLSGLRAEVRVTDGHSGLHRVEYAIGGSGWQVLRAEDGLTDSRSETYVVTLPDAAAAGVLVVRAADVMQNVTSATATGRQP